MFIRFQMICDSDRQTTEKMSKILTPTGSHVPPAMTRVRLPPDNLQQPSAASQQRQLRSAKQKSDDLAPTLAEADSRKSLKLLRWR
ncbi:MAG: hypothetical protein RLY14_2744 [Planctomycetota bacterium]|jgi:hypothetical protein